MDLVVIVKASHIVQVSLFGRIVLQAINSCKVKQRHSPTIVLLTIHNVQQKVKGSSKFLFKEALANFRIPRANPSTVSLTMASTYTMVRL